MATAKLTKRQKKGIAFRERKHGKRKDSSPSTLEVETDVRSFEDQALVDVAQNQQEHQVGAKALVGKGEEAKAQRVVVATRKGKRKVDEEEEGTPGESDQPKSKRRRGSDGSPLDGIEESVEEEGAGVGEAGKQSGKGKQRFILFVGNLKYTTTTEAIQAHFSECVPPPTIRLLSPKPSTKPLTKPVTKSKGCAFLEFKHRGALHQGLKLHHSQLDGRQINVELTAGGGGKGLTRVKKLQERNKELEGQRRKRQDSRGVAHSTGAQRFSVTSGAEQIHTHKRTWTTGDVQENKTHRGGQKHQKAKKRGSVAKDFRTGVNAIPIG